MLVSVPHTGTRSLLEILGESNFLHYGQNDTVIAEHPGPFDFPIRDPLATSISWRCYQTDRTDFDEFRRWNLAIAHLETVAHTVHVMERKPVLEGCSGPHWAKEAYVAQDMESLIKLPEVQALVEWFNMPDIRRFFYRHYDGFWWDAKKR